MGTQYETINITIGGANPQTKTVTLPVNPTTGTGTATFSYTGANGGTDTLSATATIAGKSYTSNSAQVNWQSSNGSIQVGNPVTCYAWNDSPHSGQVACYIWSTGQRPLASATATQTNNSLAFDAFSGGNSSSDPKWSVFNAAGSQTSYISFPPYTEDFNFIVLANILVPAPGNYTLTMAFKDQAMWGLGSSSTGATPTWTGKGTYTGSNGQTVTVNGNYPLLAAPYYNDGGGNSGTGTNVVNFPQAGVYPIEINGDYWYHSGRVCHVTANSAEFAPVTLISAPASSTPTTVLQITPAGGSTNLQVVNQPITLTVSVSGIVYPTVSYCPVYEGTTGYLYLYNDAATSSFNFQTYNGHAVNKSAAATPVFALSSTDNTAYQGLFTVAYNGTNFVLNYNGNTANPSSTSRVLGTSLTVTADDIAWFNGVTNSFDTYTVSGTSGGTSYNLEINYMNRPVVSSISPVSVRANGGSYTLAISLNKAFSPQQQGAFNTGNTVNCSCTISGATATGTPNPVLDSNGWLTGWNVPFTAPTATTNLTMNVNLTVSGTLTYLSGATFVTNTVTYITGVVGTIVAAGTSFVAPQSQGFSTTPTGPSIATTVTSMTATAQVFTTGTNDSVTCTFFSQAYGTSNKTTIGTGALLSSNTATVGGVSGYLQTFTLVFNPNTYINTTPGSYLGFTALDNVSNLSCTFTSTAAYILSGSGGGGGGCPDVSMFVLPEVLVGDVTAGIELDAVLFNEEGTYKSKKLPIQWVCFSDEVCYHFTTENGAEVIVSESTPVPTFESLEAHLQEHVESDGVELAYLASQIKPGMKVLTDIHGVNEWSTLTSVENVGVRRVARLYIGGENFAAGVDANKRIYTHNNLVGGGGGVK